MNECAKNREWVATNSLWVYQCCEGITILINALLKIGAVVNYGVCAHDRPEGTWLS